MMNITECVLDKLSRDQFEFQMKTKSKEIGTYLWISLRYQSIDYKLLFNLGRSFSFSLYYYGAPVIAKNDDYPFLEKDEYFNLSTEHAIPDCVLKDNYYKIQCKIEDRIKHIFRRENRYEFGMRLTDE